jgi:hypothetical protein
MPALPTMPSELGSSGSAILMANLTHYHKRVATMSATRRAIGDDG